MPKISPEIGRLSIPNFTFSHAFIEINEFEMSFPPERPFLSTTRQSSIAIVAILDHIYPRNVLLVKEFVEILDKKCIVLHTEI
jgi:hypothetical protein